MTLNVHDVAGFGKPLTKLIEVASRGMGVLYEPRRIRRAADAEAYRIRVIRAAQQEALPAPSGTSTNLSVRSPALDSALQDDDAASLRERTKARVLHQELEGQFNIERIADYAADSLPPEVSDSPVSEDWRRNFFRLAENVCADDLQMLWGKILAGEVASPGSFAVRTLEVLHGLSTEEAKIFERACGLACTGGYIMRPADDVNTALAAFGISYGDLMKLRDARLVMEGDTLAQLFKAPEIERNAPLIIGILNYNGLQLALSVSPGVTQLNLPQLPFTTAGREIQRLVQNSPNMGYLSALARFVESKGGKLRKARTVNRDGAMEIVTFDVEID